jgi:tetratricopeptide (TPR) repeat protein
MAKLIRCPAGHVYDKEAYEACPACARSGVREPHATAVTEGKTTITEDKTDERKSARKESPKRSVPISWLAGAGVVAILVIAAGFFLYHKPPSELPAAGSDQDFQTCKKDAGGEAAAACDRAIASGKFGGGDLAGLYYVRGVEHAKKNEADAALADYSRAIELDPKLPRVFNDRGSLYGGKGEFDLAIKDFDRVIELDPSNAPAFNNRGLTYKNKGDYDRAIQDLDQAIRLAPNYLLAYWNRGDAYRKKADRDHAVADYQKALSLNPPEPARKRIEAALNEIAPAAAPAPSSPSQASTADPQSDQDFQTCTKESGDAGIVACTRAIDSRKFGGHDLALLYSDRGNLLGNRNQLDFAFADYSSAIRLDPAMFGALNNRGNIFAHRGQYDDALKDFGQAIKVNPKGVASYNNRGIVYKDHGEYDRAIQDFDEAIRLDPKYTFAFNNRALAYKHKGDFDHALQDFDQAIQLDSDYLFAYWNRGDLYRDKKEFDRAVPDYQKALSLHPNEAQTKQIQESLAATQRELQGH